VPSPGEGERQALETSEALVYGIIVHPCVASVEPKFPQDFDSVHGHVVVTYHEALRLLGASHCVANCIASELLVGVGNGAGYFKLMLQFLGQ
jgi:hypothetical protein